MLCWPKLGTTTMHAVLIYKVNFRGGSGGGWLIGKYLPYNKGEKRKKKQDSVAMQSKKKIENRN